MQQSWSTTAMLYNRSVVDVKGNLSGVYAWRALRCLQDTHARWYKTLEVFRKSSGKACRVSYPRRHGGMEERWELHHTRGLFHECTVSTPRRRHWRRACEIGI